MTTTEKLARIKLKCQEIIALGEKRTPGMWRCDAEETWEIWDMTGHILANISPNQHYSYGMTSSCHNAAFIAACAGPAEAMAKSTLAAIELMTGVVDEKEYGGGHCCDNEGRGCSACFRSKKTLADILAAWPEETL